MNSTTRPRRAIGVVRVSHVAGREGERFVSPSEQRQRIEAACERDGLQLLDTFEELDVSGGAPLEQRTKGLLPAVQMIERGEADVIVAAYFDRLVRSLRVQEELVSRVEARGGQVLAVDVGHVTNGSAGQWLSGTMLGAVNEYQRRSAAERTREAQVDAVARGVAPFPSVCPGYRRGDDGVYEVDRETAPVVAEAFKMRADGATIDKLRAFMRDNGVERTYNGVLSMLSNRAVLGEIHFGELSKLDAHEAIVDRDTWRRVQSVRVTRGRKAKSARLLARAGVLRCSTCGSRMVVGTSHSSRYAQYSCPRTGDCARRMTISATVAEQAVVAEVKRLLTGMTGAASMDDNAADAELERDRIASELDAAVRAFDGVNVDAAREKLLELQDALDHADARVAELRAAVAPAVTVSVDDWDALTIDEQRDLVRAVIRRVDVAPGRGPDRITVHAFSE